MVSLPEQYVTQKIYECVSFVTYNKHNKTFNGACPFCKEGKSFGKKQRFYYIPEKELAFCHNCGYSKKTFKFILDLTGKPFNVILNEIKLLDSTIVPVTEVKKVEKPVSKSLPDDCINLSDQSQLDYYKDNKIVGACLEFVKRRRLNTAINKPKTLYISLTDRIHKNRLILPFYNVNDDIIFYQSRTILQGDTISKPNYLSKVGSEKSLSGVNSVDTSLNQLFIFEGPIDSYFIKNGLAVCGIQDESDHLFTSQQLNQINQFIGYDKIWCLDNQWCDTASLKKSFILADTEEKIFIWPEEYKQYKDINELCIATQKDQIEPEFILKNTVYGLKAKILLTKIKHS